jgi:UDP-3-O-[3-hydroxymyristoyl] glucosamine N-acyltransferase
MKLKARDLASFLNARVEGDPEIEVSEPSKIEEAMPGTISFLGNPKYEAYAYSTKASILVVADDFVPQQPIQATLLRVPNVYQSLSQLLSRFERNGQLTGVSPQAQIDPSVVLGDQAAIGPFVIMEKNVRIGARTCIHSQVYLGHDVKIGTDCILYPGVKIYAGAQIGDGVIIHANTVIGCDGFGFAPDGDGYKKIPQLGNVIIEDQVEIGANCTIDRATMGSTIIRKGCKLDNLIQIAHNVEIGEHTVIAAQSGIAGSTKIGARCMIGGQVGILGHIQIPDGSQIQAQSGVMSAGTEKNQKLFGYPAINYKDYLKSYAIFKQLPDLEARVKKVESQLSSAEHKLENT